MISWVPGSVCQVPHIISAEVLKEIHSDFQLSMSLGVALRTGSLNAPDEEIVDFFVLHGFDQSSADLS